jgi:hypothetical protein
MNVVANIDTTPTNHKQHQRSSDTWKMFDVPTEVFRRFETGRNKFERWSKYLDTSDESQAEILNYAKKQPKNTIILRDSTNGVLRQIRRRAANHA